MTTPGAERVPADTQPARRPPTLPARTQDRAPLRRVARSTARGTALYTAQPHLARQGRGQRIVVVDDEPDIVAILAEVLQAEDYVAETFTHSMRALESIMLSPPALLLTDLYMPYLSGAELVKRVHTAEATLPIIIMSASANIRSLAGLPAQAFLGKPFDLDELSELVAKLLHV